ncbi:D-aminoacyl-tRNA deacylase [Flavobacterium silvaticum]|uniref:D-aminoacyl-tRNA deacylase n=1 Tax=Flavobacterium silvaticum TaxID=1852020 RepID=A0A972FYM8_9FLAO|nr:D-aminoacyl-tRNA deacylase [Flavobacterium silvaticum]NMH27246.1 D-tyrosyl-tRNA(Tyr) deacylase [Flavobacterium silvaticum]
MRVVIQRVSEASVTVDGEIIGQIGTGLLVFVGIEDADSKEDIDWLCAKIANLRIFNDADNVMNLSAKDVSAELLIISQFTLHALTKKGNRPSYIKAARPEVAIPLYEAFLTQMKAETSGMVEAGKFGADMKIRLLNDGPVTIVMDSKNRE